MIAPSLNVSAVFSWFSMALIREPRYWCAITLALSMFCGVVTACVDEDATYFHDRVVPILQRRCFGCHSHSASELGGGLALDWRSGWETGGDSGPAIVPGNTSASLLVRAILHQDATLKMPEQKLDDAELNVLIRWIERGAFDDRILKSPVDSTSRELWWSLRPLTPKSPLLHVEMPHDAPTMESASSLPESNEDSNWIDGYIAYSQRNKELEWSGVADRRTLLRRVYYDLIGLPPTWEQVAAFENDSREDAYERIVDELLASPRYGERWARHWLDTIHFADSHGYEHDVGRDHAWPYRDYVVHALNADLPWDSFIQQQLAADKLFPDKPELTPALGFLGAGTFDLSTYSTATVTFEYLDRDDLVTQTMAAFASTTANCARCHSHKFDPIPQEDYYALQSVFAGVVKGDLSYDVRNDVARERKRLEQLIASAQSMDAKILLADEHRAIVNAWISSQTRAPRWNVIDPVTFQSSGGATIERHSDSVFLVTGSKPERDDYSVVVALPPTEIRAFRLDVLAHSSLPSDGPGRAENGNLHLSEFEVTLFEPNATTGKRLEFNSTIADFNQSGWGVERAIDGDLKTAWGIHPMVGQNHSAVFRLPEPIHVPVNGYFVVNMRQQHGGAHTIGAYRLSWSNDAVADVKPMTIDIEKGLVKPEASRTEEDRLVLARQAIVEYAENALRQLPQKQTVYAAGQSVSIPTGNGQSTKASVAKPKAVHVLARGDFDKPRSPATPGALSAVTSLDSRFDIDNVEDESERRAALARWLSHRENPLTWRSVVNRVWHYHFGIGLCDTPSDFGKMGGIPSHPELIDALAIWFRDDAHMRLKDLHRLIVTSRVYRQSSVYNDRSNQIDQGNRWLWRQNRHRLDADAIRDYISSASGELSLHMGGPGVQHFRQSPGPQSTPSLDYSSFDWSKPGSSRRSIYRYVWRGIADPFMESLDFPDLGLLSPARGFSASSLQSLTLFNDDFVLFHSARLAQMGMDHDGDLHRQVAYCVQRCWQRQPSGDELAIFVAHAEKYGLASMCRVLFNSNEFLFLD